jgi:hypothetical protein
MVSIGKLLLYGLVGAFAISALADPSRAYATTQAFKGVGGALGSLGSGLLSLGTGTGTGISKLLNPLFTLRDLIYGPQGGAQTPKDMQEITSVGAIATTPQYIQASEQIQREPEILTRPGFSYKMVPSISSQPVAPAIVHGQNVPLSAQAVNYYQALGVAVTPGNPSTVQGVNSSNATSNSAQSATFRKGAAQAAGYSTGSPQSAL